MVAMGGRGGGVLVFGVAAAVLARAETLTSLRVSPEALGTPATPCTAHLQQGRAVGELHMAFPTCTYKGIPYAQAPMGERRFAPPAPALPFVNGEYLATEYGNGCPQVCDLQHPDLTCPKTYSEDCLNLNVYTPVTQGPDAARTQTLPVLVFFHGGNYVAGSGGTKLYHGSRWASRQNTVVVTINYRLGVLGGLFTRRGDIQGNFQLQDQRLALRWVRDNIHAFGGNPELVTIFGQSAGGFSVAAHLASPKSWPFFQRAVMISDPLALPTETTSKSVRISKRVVRALGCSRWSERDEDACLRSVPVDTIIEAQSNVSFPTEPGMILHKFMPWTPVIDEEELPLSPMQAAEQGKLAPVPIMLGSVANESVQFIWEASPKPMDKLMYELYVDAIFGFSDARSIFSLYGDPPPPLVEGKDVRSFLARLGTDYIFTCSLQYFARQAARFGPVYVYHFSHLLSFNEFMQGHWLPECMPYVCHGSDLPILFDTVYMSGEANHPFPTFRESLLSTQMQTAWTNFARTGDPNLPRAIPAGSEDVNEALEFPPFTGESRRTFELGSGEVLHNLKGHYCALFDKIGYERN